jgi:hypothetical protein
MVIFRASPMTLALVWWRSSIAMRAFEEEFCIATANIYVVSLYTFTIVAIGLCELTDMIPKTFGLFSPGARDLFDNIRVTEKSIFANIRFKFVYKIKNPRSAVNQCHPDFGPNFCRRGSVGRIECRRLKCHPYTLTWGSALHQIGNTARNIFQLTFVESWSR